MTNLFGELRDPDPPLDVPARVLTIGAHPDDAEFGAGGTLARWAGAGASITMAIVTDGSKGTWDPQADPALIAEERRAEQTHAAAALGGADVVWMGHVDGELEESMALRAEMALLVRTQRPDVVLTHDPWRRYQLHPDHRVTGFAVVDGIVAARDPLFFPEQLDAPIRPHRPSSLLLWSPDEPDHWESVAATLEAKVAALLCHSSQRVTTMGGDHDAAAESFRDRIVARAREAGAAGGLDAAEPFRRLTP